MADKPLISADSHFVEPPKMWAERLDARFRDRAPRAVKLEGKPGEYLACEDMAAKSAANPGSSVRSRTAPSSFRTQRVAIGSAAWVTGHDARSAIRGSSRAAVPVP